MWKDDRDEIDDLWCGFLNKSDRYPCKCPICKKRDAHICVHRYQGKKGTAWMWCSECRHCTHGTMFIPGWWEDDDFIDIYRTASHPDYLETQKIAIDSYVNRVLDNTKNFIKGDVDAGHCNAFIRISKKDLQEAGLRDSNFTFEGRLSVLAGSDIDSPRQAYDENPIADDQAILHIGVILDQFLDWSPPFKYITLGRENMMKAKENNDMEAFHVQEKILRSHIVIRFLGKICELNRFSIYIFENDGRIDQRIEYTKDMDIFSLVIDILGYDTPQNVEIYRK